MSWDGIIGLMEAKRTIREILELPSLLPPNTLVGIRALPSTVLLYGPPGTGKTLLAEAASAEARLPLFSVAPSAIFSMYLGEAEKALRRVFEDAAGSPGRGNSGPAAVLFLDELDALGGARGDGGGGGGGAALCEGGGARRVLNELLLLLSRYCGGSGGRILVIAATNRPQDLDPALLRRFQRQIFCGLPLPAERLCFSRAALADVDCALGSNGALEWLCGEPTFGWSCSDLRALLAYAAMEPLREAMAAARGGSGGAALVIAPVQRRHLEAALAAVGPLGKVGGAGGGNSGGGNGGGDNAFGQPRGGGAGAGWVSEAGSAGSRATPAAAQPRMAADDDAAPSPQFHRALEELMRGGE